MVFNLSTWVANRAASPPALGPLGEGPFGGPEDPDNPEFNEEHDLYWMYGEHAGGWKFDFGKHKGQKIYETSWSYLKHQFNWCTEADGPRFDAFLEAFTRYRDGMFNWIATNYDQYTVPRGKHQGKRIYQCTKGWMEYILNHATTSNERKWINYEEKNDLLIRAIRHKLGNPRRQNVKRDVGENLNTTKWEDEQDLKRDDYSDPDEYDTDDDYEDEDEDGSEHAEGSAEELGRQEAANDNDSGSDDGQVDLSQLDRMCEEVDKAHRAAKTLTKRKFADPPPTTPPSSRKAKANANFRIESSSEEEDEDNLPVPQLRSRRKRKGKRESENLESPSSRYSKTGIDGSHLKRLRHCI